MLPALTLVVGFLILVVDGAHTVSTFDLVLELIPICSYVFAENLRLSDVPFLLDRNGLLHLRAAED